MLEKSMPAPSDDTLIATCGPPMMNLNCKRFLKNLGHKEENVISF